MGINHVNSIDQFFLPRVKAFLAQITQVIIVKNKQLNNNNNNKIISRYLPSLSNKPVAGFPSWPLGTWPSIHGNLSLDFSVEETKSLDQFIVNWVCVSQALNDCFNHHATRVSCSDQSGYACCDFNQSEATTKTNRHLLFARFPALCADGTFLLWVLIGWFRYYSFDMLKEMKKMVWFKNINLLVFFFFIQMLLFSLDL